MKQSSFSWPAAGFLFTSATGTLLHFLYDWSCQSLLAALFSAVNESVWEHMKLLFFPMLFFAVIQHRFAVREHCSFWCVTLAGTVLGLALIPILYYSYTGILGVSADWFNIAIFFLAAGAAFALEKRLFAQKYKCPLPGWYCFLFLCLIAGLFALFTFIPPHLPLFQDPLTGRYGLSG